MICDGSNELPLIVSEKLASITPFCRSRLKYKSSGKVTSAVNSDTAAAALAATAVTSFPVTSLTPSELIARNDVLSSTASEGNALMLSMSSLVSTTTISVEVFAVVTFPPVRSNCVTPAADPFAALCKLNAVIETESGDTVSENTSVSDSLVMFRSNDTKLGGVRSSSKLSALMALLSFLPVTLLPRISLIMLLVKLKYVSLLDVAIAADLTSFKSSTVMLI